jgi:transposase-like protein
MSSLRASIELRLAGAHTDWRRCQSPSWPGRVAVVQEAYVNGVSTPRVDRLVEQLGVAGFGKDKVSRLCRETGDGSS